MCSRPWLALLLLAAACGKGPSGPVCGSDEPDCNLPPVTCPPPGPYGFDEGSTLTNLQLPTCDGAALSLHDLCGARAGLLVSFYGWCPSCYDIVRMAEELDTAHRDAGLSTVVVVSEDPLEVPSTADYCASMRDYFGLETHVVYDPTAAFEAYGTTDLVMVTSRESTIVMKRNDATEAAVRAAVEQELGRYE